MAAQGRSLPGRNNPQLSDLMTLSNGLLTWHARNPDGNFQFISIRGPEGATDRETKRRARSHAVKRALENKRKRQQEAGDHFRTVTLEARPSRPVRREARSRRASTDATAHTTELTTELSLFRPDPFQMLAADAWRLQPWLYQKKSCPTAKPVFSIAEELVLQNFCRIFRMGLSDPALLNATRLVFTFAITGTINRECLGYHNRALNSIRESMTCTDRAASEPTLAAILLLAGLEARLGMPCQVQLHMNAIHHLLGVCRTRGMHLTNGIKRAIFWQDLNASVMTGSRRIVDHTTFAELLWTRDPFTPDAFILPPGFQERAHLLPDDFIDVLKDIHAMQCIRENVPVGSIDSAGLARIDNHQASIQSRLAASPTVCAFVNCCYVAAYLCSAVLRCKLWQNSVIPPCLSLQLLNKLQQTKLDRVWDKHAELLVWMLHIGGAFAPSPTAQSEYTDLLHQTHKPRIEDICATWEGVLETMKKFVWSDKAFLQDVKAFWHKVWSADASAMALGDFNNDTAACF